MKKLIIIICILALVLTAGVIYKLMTIELPVDKVLPSGAIAYIQVSDAQKQIDEFKNTRLWKNVENIDIEMLMGKGRASKKDIEKYRDAKQWFASAFGGSVMNGLFGKEIALAVYPSNILLHGIASNVILVTRVKPAADFTEFALKLMNRAERKVNVTEEVYDRKKITIIKINDNKELAYTKIKDMLVISIGKTAIVSCIDVSRKYKPSLSQDKDYISAMSKLSKNSSIFFYDNIQLSASLIKQSAAPNPQISKTLDLYSGFKTLGCAYYMKDKKLETVFSYNKAAMSLLYAKMYSLAPRKNETIKFAPENAIIYQWGTFDIKSYWEYFKSKIDEQFKQGDQRNKMPSPVSFIPGIEGKLGMSIDNELIPAIGDEIAFILTDINVDGIFPIPEFTVCIKVKNKATIEKLLGSLSQSGSAFKSEEYKSINLKYIALPFGTSLQPAYCYIGNYLLIAVGRKSIKESIDASRGDSKSLLESEDFKAVDHGFTEECNSVHFLKAGILMQRIESVCEWFYGWMELLQKQAEKYNETLKAKADVLAADILVYETDLGKSTANLRALQANASAKRADLDSLEMSIAGNRKILDEKKKSLEQIRKMANRPPAKKVDLVMARLYLDELAYPILDGMQFVKAVGSRTVIGNDLTRSESYFKIAEHDNIVWTHADHMRKSKAYTKLNINTAESPDNAGLTSHAEDAIKTLPSPAETIAEKNNITDKLSLPDIKLSATTASGAPEKRIAVINNAIHHIGDSIAGYKIDEIKDGYVVLIDDKGDKHEIHT